MLNQGTLVFSLGLSRGSRVNTFLLTRLTGEHLPRTRLTGEHTLR
jgi:hypothetical protein